MKLLNMVPSFYFIRIYFMRISKLKFAKIKNILRINPRLRFWKGYNFLHEKICKYSTIIECIAAVNLLIVVIG